MKLLDRLTGKTIESNDLTDSITPGRYQLSDDAEIYPHTVMKCNDMLLSDGTGEIMIGDRRIACQDRIETREEQSKYDIQTNAIIQIHHTITENPDSWPSPLVPSKLFDDSGAQNELVETIESVLTEGHLFEIDQRPYIDIHYVDMLTDVHRARRVSSKSYSHLAAQTKYWHKRTVSGIVPRKILCRVSEDQFVLYENKVFARLIDRLERYLNKQLNDLKTLQDNINQILELKTTQHLHHRTSNKVFSIWGEIFNDKKTEETLSILQNKQETIAFQLKTMRRLKQGFLYSRIPAGAYIPEKIQMTNVLAHNPHYRQLTRLWNMAHKQTMEKDHMLPKEVLQKNKELQNAYINYCKLLILRSLKELGYTIKNNDNDIYTCKSFKHQINICLTQSRWILEETYENNEIFSTKRQLIFVPVATWNCKELNIIQHENQLIIPCCLYSSEQSKLPSEWIDGKFTGALMLSPLDLYIQERLIGLLRNWIWYKAIHSYGKDIQKVPLPLISTIKSIPEIEIITDHMVRFLKPVSYEKKENIRKKCMEIYSSETHKHFEKSMVLLEQLSICICCNKKTRNFEPWSNKCFKAFCKECSLEWGIYHNGKNREFRMFFQAFKSDKFTDNGRFFDKFVLKEEAIK
jgi:hypothetical protein